MKVRKKKHNPLWSTTFHGSLKRIGESQYDIKNEEIWSKIEFVPIPECTLNEVIVNFALGINCTHCITVLITEL